MANQTQARADLDRLLAYGATVAVYDSAGQTLLPEWPAGLVLWGRGGRRIAYIQAFGERPHAHTVERVERGEDEVVVWVTEGSGAHQARYRMVFRPAALPNERRVVEAWANLMRHQRQDYEQDLRELL